MKVTNEVKTETVYNLELTKREFVAILACCGMVTPPEAVKFANQMFREDGIEIIISDIHKVYDSLKENFGVK